MQIRVTDGVVVDLEPDEVSGRFARCRLHLEVGGWDLTANFIVGGWELQVFVDDLASLYDLLEGEAVLSTTDNEAPLHFNVISRGGGVIGICGEMRLYLGSADTSNASWPCGPSDVPGIQLAYSGLSMDQTYLPDVIRGFRRFLRETGIWTRSPVG